MNPCPTRSAATAATPQVTRERSAIDSSRSMGRPREQRNENVIERARQNPSLRTKGRKVAERDVSSARKEHDAISYLLGVSELVDAGDHGRRWIGNFAHHREDLAQLQRIERR